MIVDVIKAAYVNITHERLPIFDIPNSSKLTDYVTTKADVAKGITRIPDEKL